MWKEVYFVLHKLILSVNNITVCASLRMCAERVCGHASIARSHLARELLEHNDFLDVYHVLSTHNPVSHLDLWIFSSQFGF